jgi:chromosome segregation protein
LRAAREEDSASRSALLRADETYTALEAKVNALEALERERVGLGSRCSASLEERERLVREQSSDC